MAGISLRRLARLVPLAAGQGIGIEQQDRIDVGAVIQLARALLAQCQPDKAGGVTIWHTVAHCSQHCGMERAIRKSAQFLHDPCQRKGPGKIAHPQHQCQRQSLPAQREACIFRALATCLGNCQRLIALTLLQHFAKFRSPLQRQPQEGRMLLRTVNCRFPVPSHIRACHVRSAFIAIGPARSRAARQGVRHSLPRIAHGAKTVGNTQFKTRRGPYDPQVCPRRAVGACRLLHHSGAGAAANLARNHAGCDAHPFFRCV